MVKASSEYKVVRDANDFYDLGDQIAEGGFAFLHKASRKRVQPVSSKSKPETQNVAIKIFNHIEENCCKSENSQTRSGGRSHKRCRPGFASSLDCIRNEISILKSLQKSDYIVSFQEALYVNDKFNQFWIVTELHDMDLCKLIQLRGKGLNGLQLDLVSSCVAQAIDYMHDKNIIHGDIKANNILISSRGEIKLCDFGLAKQLSKKNQFALCGNRFSG